jgi:aerotaxis receptor
MVKNRRENGDFYSGVANVDPVKERGRTVGYMSVRTCPTRGQVAAAAELYRRIAAGEAAGIATRHGAAVRTGLAARVKARRNLPLGTRLSLLMGAQATLLGALAVQVAAAGAALTLAAWNHRR